MPSPMRAPNLRAYYSKKQRRALVQMARSCGVIDAERYPDTPEGNLELLANPPKEYRDTPEGNLALWLAVSEEISRGVADPSARVAGDPFGTFVTGRCMNLAKHPGGQEYRQTAVIRTEGRVDQAEGERQIAYLKAQPNVNTCEVCGEPISVWECDHTRFSTFRARPENRNWEMASPIRGDV